MIDSDPGVDDAIALLLAFEKKEQILGISSVGGNIPVNLAFENICGLLRKTNNKNIPIAKGSKTPIQGKYSYSYSYHGKYGLPFRIPYKSDDFRNIIFDNFTKFLKTMFKTYGEISLIALGPLTNFAIFFSKYPQYEKLVKSFFIMGGAIGVSGNVTSYSEFNFFSDPYAANLIVNSKLPITLIDLNICNQFFLTRNTKEILSQTNNLSANLSYDLISRWFEQHPTNNRFVLFDPLTMILAFQPSIASYKQIPINIEIKNQKTLGKSKLDFQGSLITVVDNIDKKKFWKEFAKYFSLDKKLLLPML